MATAGEPLLLGRDAVSARLSERLARAARGAGGLVWVSGEAGIGKTRILGEARRLADGLGFRVLHGAGWEDPGTPPFWLWVQVLRDAFGDTAGDRDWGPRAAEALALLPGTAVAAAPAADRFALFDAVAAVLERVAEEGPLLVVLDDVHWTDAGSLRLLGFVERTLAHRPVLCVAGWRDHEAAPDPVVAELAAELATRADRIELTGLDAEAVGDLVRAEAGLALDGDEARRVCERSGGNPLFVAELARLAADRGTGAILAEVPGSATAVIRRRLGRVSQACHELLVAAAVAGNASTVDVVQHLTGRSPQEVAALVDEAVAAGLARDVPGRVELPHALVRAAVAGSVPAGRVRELHRDVAELLDGRLAGDPTVAAEVAGHLHRAIPLVDAADAVAMSRRAADAAMARQAWEEAAEHLTAALGASPPASEVRRQVLLERGRAVLAHEDLEAARGDFVEAARLARACGDGDALAEAALGFAAGLGGFEVRLWDQAQLDLLEEALALLGEREVVARADVMARLSVAVSFTGSEERRARLAEDAVALARRLDDPRATAHALAARCDTISGPAYSERREADAGEVVALARRAGDRPLELLGLRLRVVARLEQGLLQAARQDMVAFEVAARTLRQPLYSWYVPLFRGFLAHAEGDIAELLRCAGEAERIGRQAGSHNALILAAVQRSWAAIEQCRPGDILAELSGLITAFAETAPGGMEVLGLFPGQPAAVRTAALRSLPEAVASMSDDSELLSNLCLVALAGRDAGDPPSAAATLRAALEPWSRRFAVDGIGAGAIGPVARFVGELLLLEGDPDRAEAALVQAERDAASAGAVLAGVHARRSRADVLLARRGPGDVEAAAALLADARASYDALGLDARAALAAEAAAGLGAPGAPGAPEPDAATGSFRRAGGVWQVSFNGSAAVVRHVKGMSDLAVLLGRPGQEVHALDLAGAPGGAAPEGDTGPVLDEAARASYKRRLGELEEEIDAAALDGDAERQVRAEEERSFLVAELGAAYGLGGRARRTGAAAERARSAVTWRIRDAIRRIEEVDPALAGHLRRSVRTGTFCCYDPERPTAWECGDLPV
ncbi:hypothetical protein CFH99_11385 [Nocardioides aromaticivorans]|uniref:Orc1-like AAA ATPase domain-containing protein n=1 Tax=Nocardioides aromaticivorans TaxID=200618 RepID=A0ABX7PKQ8_9ACTN|nr:AAA family ATPase [Nocardioides aromaticivorans]QSR26230.1 hypothetical protein CFH99_11385 [Nocardioides aromaticivorans]